MLRRCVRALLRRLFRVRVTGLEHHPLSAPHLLVVADHVSRLDGRFLCLFLPRAPAFAVNRDGAAPVRTAPLRLGTWAELDLLNPGSVKSLVRLVRDGHHTVLFPEGRISNTGTPMKVYDGAGLVVDKSEALLLPVGLDGLQHSFGAPLGGLLRRRALPRVTLHILPPRRLALDATLAGAERRAAATAAGADPAGHRPGHARVDGGVRCAGRRLWPPRPRTTALEDVAVPPELWSARCAASCWAVSSRARAAWGAHRHPAASTAAGVVTLLACLARGRVPAMLNFTAGARGLVTAVETAGITVVVSARAFVAAAGLDDEIAALETVATVRFLEDLRERVTLGTKLGAFTSARWPRLALRLLHHGRTAGDAAVVLFTSGSEGIPKGVVLSHANLLANYAQVHMLIDLTRRDCVLNVLPISHAFGLLGGVLLPLLKGTPSYQYPSPLHYRLIPELCYERGVTCLFGTTTFLRGYGRHAHPYDFYRMRFVIAGAEKLTDDVRNLWQEKFGIRIFEGYGATEASPVLAVNYPLASRPGTVGKLLPGIEHYLEPVPGIAEGGELVVRGPNIMQGYLFHGSDGHIIPPWTPSRGAGWYATGDIVTLDADGYVTIRGRAKRFAKIGGEMVSLAAVEELAYTLAPEARHAALAVSDARKGEQIVLISEAPALTRAELHDAAKTAQVSELAVPRRIVHRDALPLLGSGKIDYTALRSQLERP